MLDTCFFFMISDYIMADGSLANVLAKMQAGYSGVVAGNFQVVEESAQDSFFKTFDTGRPQAGRSCARFDAVGARIICIPMTLANMVNFPLCHSAHSNRLFWRVDDNTLIGRFYLMHMICIRPEITDFVVGSSCDYSFIPEMCPSGKVYVMADSDDYLVVEMQKRSHERDFVRLGAVKQSVAGRKSCRMGDGDAIARMRILRSSSMPRICRRASNRVVAESGAYIEDDRTAPCRRRSRIAIIHIG